MRRRDYARGADVIDAGRLPGVGESAFFADLDDIMANLPKGGKSGRKKNLQDEEDDDLW